MGSQCEDPPKVGLKTALPCPAPYQYGRFVSVHVQQTTPGGPKFCPYYYPDFCSAPASKKGYFFAALPRKRRLIRRLLGHHTVIMSNLGSNCVGHHVGYGPFRSVRVRSLRGVFQYSIKDDFFVCTIDPSEKGSDSAISFQ